MVLTHFCGELNFGNSGKLLKLSPLWAAVASSNCNIRIHSLERIYRFHTYNMLCLIRVEWQWLLQSKVEPQGVAGLKHDSAWLKKGETWYLHRCDMLSMW